MKKNYFEYTLWYKVVTFIFIFIAVPLITYWLSGVKVTAFLSILALCVLLVVYAFISSHENEKRLINFLERYGEKIDPPETEVWETNYAWIDNKNYTCCISILGEGIHVKGSRRCSYLVRWENISKIELFTIKVSCVARLFLNKEGRYSSKLCIPWNDEFRKLLPAYISVD